MGGQARDIVLDGEIAVPDDRGVTHIDDLQDAIVGTGRLEPNSDQAGRAPRWRLLEARRPGVDIIAGASLARRTVNLPSSIVKIRLATGPVRRRQVRGGLEKMLSLTGDRGFESGFLQRRVTNEPFWGRSRRRSDRGGAGA